MKAWAGRVAIFRRRGSLGTLFDTLSEVDGARVLVQEIVTGSGSGSRSGLAGEAAPLSVAGAAARVRGVAGGVGERCRPGDRVVVALPNSYDTLLTCAAVARAGCVAVPVNPLMTSVEIEHVVADSGATLVLDGTDDIAGDERAAAPVNRSDVAVIFYSSGTTGAPKGARITHEGLLTQVALAAAWPRHGRRDEAVVGLPVAHIMGFVVLLAFAVAGVPVAFLPRFRPDVALDAIEQRRATIFVGVPAMYRMLLDAGAEQRDLRSVRLWASGADVMPDDLARRFQRMGATATVPLVGNLGEATFVDGYGLVEAGGGVALGVRPANLPLPSGRRLAMPVPPYRVRVVGDDGRDAGFGEVGELWVKGPGVLAGYHGDPEATRRAVTADGWLRTGDLVRRGLFGFNVFQGREKDVIKHGGYSVGAVEVERVLERHPAVAEAAVVGLPDERLGERVVAAVRLRAGERASEADLIEWAAARLTAYKVPSEVRFVDDLPRTGTEKVRRAEVKEWLTRGTTRAE